MKFFKKNKLHIAAYISLVIFFFAGIVWSEKPYDMSHVTNLWIGDMDDTADVTPGDNDTFISGTLEVDGAVRFDGGLTANVTRSFTLQLGAGGVDGGYDLDESSTPDLSTCDGIPCLVWADSGETTAVGWTFRLPSDFVSSLVVYAFVSSNAASGSGQLLDWCVWENIDGTTFDAACIAQAAVECTSATLSASNEVLTLTSDATAETAYTAGDWITLEFFNASTDDDDLELKGLEVTYTATQ